jgi:nitronate monooxygenase
VDVIVAQGWEAGGHVWGKVATLPLVPAVVDAVAPVPVIAAGGIGDARGVAAVLALGAQAAWLGTRFLLAQEMPIHEDYRRRLIAAAETDPQWYPNLYDVGWPDSPHRALRNSTAEAWEAAGCPPDGQRPGAGDVIAHFASGEPIVRYEPAPPMTGTTGDIEALSMWAGQDVALARQVQPAADIVAELTARLLRGRSRSRGPALSSENDQAEGATAARAVHEALGERRARSTTAPSPSGSTTRSSSPGGGSSFAS